MHPFPQHIKPCRVMVFVDGENLAIRWKSKIAEEKVPSHVECEPNVFVWSRIRMFRAQFPLVNLSSAPRGLNAVLGPQVVGEQSMFSGRISEERQTPAISDGDGQSRLNE